MPFPEKRNEKEETNPNFCVKKTDLKKSGLYLLLQRMKRTEQYDEIMKFLPAKTTLNIK